MQFNQRKEVPFSVKVNAGFFTGISAIDKFGLNETITASSDPEDIWEYGGTYTFSDTADITSISSSDDTDTQNIKIYGLDADGNDVIQTITLTGQTIVTLDTTLWRVYRMENESSTDIAGTVYCYVGTDATLGVPNTATDVRAVIVGDNNQTQMAIYTIPKDKVAFLIRGEAGIEFTGTVGTGTNFARGSYLSRQNGKIFKTKKTFTLINNANSIYQDNRSFSDVIPELTDIVLRVQEVSEDMGVWGTFDIMLVDKSEFSESYLNSIGMSNA